MERDRPHVLLKQWQMEKNAFLAATHFSWMCCFHVNLQSIVQPRYVRCSDGEMHVPSTVMCTAPGFRFVQKIMRTVLAPLKANFASWPKTAAESHIDCKFLAAWSSETADVTKTRSSAYAIILKRKENSEWRKESIYRFHRKGDSTLPCGQPTDRKVDIFISIYSRVAYLSFKKLLKIFIR